MVHLQHLTGSTREILLYYIESNVPPGVGIEVRSFKLAQFTEKMKVCPPPLSKGGYIICGGRPPTPPTLYRCSGSYIIQGGPILPKVLILPNLTYAKSLFLA